MLQGLYAAIDRDSRSSTPSMDVILRFEVYALSSKGIEQRSVVSARSQPRCDHSRATPTRAAVSILVRTDPKHLEGLMGAGRPAIYDLCEFYWNPRLRAQAELRICSSTGLAIVVNFAERLRHEAAC